MTVQRIKHKLEDRYVQALTEFADNQTWVAWDTQVAGLRVRVGKQRITWSFKREHRHGPKRSATVKVLGYWPYMSTAQARKEALKIAGRIAAGRIEPGRRAATKFEDALADHIVYLERLAKENDKPAMWAGVVRRLGKQLLLPAWGHSSLAEMSEGRRAVAQWHRKITDDHGPIIANRCVEIIRAVYKRAAKAEDLPPRLPSSAVDLNKERRSQAGLPFEMYPAWAAAWRKLRSPVHRGYAALCLYSGMRPGEAGKLRWGDVHCKSRSIAIIKGKTGDASIPMSSAIARALKLARGADPVLIFPGCKQAGHRLALPAKGNALRRGFRTVAGDLGIDPVSISMLMNHSLQGVNAGYLTKAIMAGGPGLRATQRRISKRITELLGGALKPLSRDG
jgi:integrase